jgi:uncharacterized repeat protein (TIGR01451 family)
MFSSRALPAATTAAGHRTRARSFLRRVCAPIALRTALLAALVGLATAAAPDAHAQFVTGGALVPGPSAANFTLWGTIASPTTGVLKIDDGFDFASGGNSGANFARVWIAVGTQLGGNTSVSASDTVQYVYIRIDHKGAAEEGSNFNMQLNLGGAPAGRVDHLLSLRPVFSGPNKPLSGRVRIALKQYATDAGGNFPLLGAFTTSSFVSGSAIDNASATAEGTAIGWDAVATDGKNGFEVRIPAGWFHGDPTRLVQPDGSGASSVVAALFSSGGSFGAVATVLDKLADASGNNVLVNLSTTTGAHTTVVGTQLAYGTQPAAAFAAATLGAFTVKQLNADATTVTGGTASISLAIASGPVGGTITGTTTRAASSGLATFNDISFSVPGTYTLTASSTGLLSATSSSFIISATTAGAPTITSITPGNAQLSVAFTAPASDGGSAITTYQYSTNDGSSWSPRATGTTASPLLITGLTNGTTYTVRVRAVNGVGNGTQSNSLTGTPDAPAPPSNSVVPAISGTTTVGQTLTTTTGTWAGSPVPTYGYQWKRCDAAGANCANVAGATSNQYVLVSADVGSTMRSVVTGTNTNGTASATSAQTAVVAEPPVNTVAPSITGTTESGQLLSAATGTWTGTPTPTYSYQWQRCDASGASCASIASATASTYTLTGADVGATVRVAVTGTNTAGNATGTSNQTTTITDAPAAPVNTVAPAISGTSTVGQQLTATSGAWTGFPAPTYAYQWRRCDASGNACADLAGETASTYTLASADAGSTMRVVVTGTNASGNSTGTSTQTAAVAEPPANTVAPSISGTATQGQLLSALSGTWTGYPVPALTYQWLRCDGSGANCSSIASAMASSYTLASADIGSTVRVAVTGTNSAGSTAVNTAQTATIAPAPAAPVNTIAPATTGTTTAGQTLSATPGTWTGYPAPTFGYQWRRCDLSGSNCADIAGETTGSYTLAARDVGATMRVSETGTNASGSAAASSAPTATVNEAPINTVAPVVSGTTTEGQTLGASTGTWTGYPTPTLGYQWERCNAAGGSCASIAGATSSSYVLAAADIGATVRAVVTGTNSVGSADATSAASAVISAAGVAPSSAAAPTVSGTRTVGQILTATDGSWNGTPAPSLAHQWERCDAAGNNCASVGGATASTYTLVLADTGSTMRVAVTATNATGNATATSAATTVVNLPPANVAVPAIGGSAVSGQTLTASGGTWTGSPSPTLAYQWERCDASGANCSSIAGETASSYTLASADIGATVRVSVTGTNVAGNASATAVQTAAIAAAAAAPVSPALPTIAGTTTTGQTLTLTPGTWTGVPAPTLTHQWQRCDLGGSNCANVAGQTATTYTLVSADAGSTMRVVETGTNGTGSASASSAQTAAVNMAPVDAVLPAITGTATAGQTLSASTGSWSGYPVPTYSYQWERCDGAGANCASIASATASSYLLATGDVGATVRIVVTGTNSSGNAAATTTTTGVVSAANAAPVNTVAPAISGTTTVGQLLTAGTGSWTGFPAPSYTYQWRRCDAAGNTCADIGSATASTYTLASADAGTTIRVVVTGTNATGSAAGTSTQAGVILDAPANTAAPTFSGTTVSGQILTAADGTWTGTPAPTFGYQWQRCDASGANCANIGSATAGTYTLTDSEIGSTVRVAVTGTNSVGNATGTSAQTAVVTAAPAAPASTVAPSISGTTTEGQFLTAGTGTWTGYPAPTLAYQWQRCDASGNNCTSIASATSNTYTLASADVGVTVRVVVTGTNSAGNATATAPQSATIVAGPAAPANTTLTTIGGTTTVGQVLTATPGTWSGNPAPALSYQWQRCDASGANCTNVGGATAITYTLVSADTASTMRVVETGTNASGTSGATSAQTAAVNLAPANTALPVLSGTVTEGQTLSAGTGSWTGFPVPTLGYQWKRCDAAGNGCANIAGATSSSYVLASADVGVTVRVEVTGTNSVGSATVSTVASSAIAAAGVSPANSAIPMVSGTTTVGSVLTTSTGTWTGTPAPTLTHQWTRCDASGSNCANVAGATASTYTLVVADTGATLRVAVTGTNASGSSTTSSAQTATVNMPPASTTAPTISGNAVAGQQLTAADGTWTGSPAPALAYQWARCDAAGSNCSNIAGAIAGTYTLDAADVGSTVRVNVTGTNATGTATGTSSLTVAVAAATTAPAVVTPPTISGTVGVGKPLAVTVATFSGVPAPVVTTQWQRCDASGANCVDIAGETGATYLPTVTDQGKTIRAKTTGTNSAGSASRSSTVTIVVPVLTLPTVAGVPQAGITLTAAPGNWAEPSPVAYQWQRCDATGANCTIITGATLQSYTPGSADIGFTIQVSVTATASGVVETARTALVGKAKPMAGSSKVYAAAIGSMAAPPASSAPADSTPADGTRFALVRVELFDAAGKPIAGRTGSDFTVSVAGVAVATPVRETTTPGIYELEVRSTAVNQATIAITIDGVRLTQEATVRFVAATANLDIALSASAESPAIGQAVVFTIVVKNPGPDAATGVEVEHELGARVRYVSSDATRGQYDPARGIWSIGGIALGESVSLKVTVTVIK